MAGRTRKGGGVTWKRNVASLRTFFTQKEITRLEAARKRVRLDDAVIAYCAYENPFAKSGGIFAVADNYAAALIERGQRAVVLSPYHYNLETAPTPSQAPAIGTCQVSFDGGPVPVTLYEHVRRGVRWILFGAEGFFDAAGGEACTDPYIHDDPSKLLTDSLFASAALPEVLRASGLVENVIVHLQDWEFASAALTLKQALLEGVLTSAAVTLTSHNPYDHELTPEALGRITRRRYRGKTPPETVYQHMIPLTDAPVSTVSETFARELISDPLQTRHFADHLQGIFKGHGLVGVDDGLFGEPRQAYSQAALRGVAQGDPSALLEEKRLKRRAMLDELTQYKDSRILGGIDGGDGRPITDLPDDVPLFFMFGRLEPGQKGFDALARAIEAMPRGQARFVLAPIVAGASQPYRDDLNRLVEAARPGDVAVYPFRMARAYGELMAGATYAVMPSIYEPFGAATEPYLAGTPVVARATGGLVQQVTDVDADRDRGTGLLYREQDAGIKDLGLQWRGIQRAERPADRMGFPLYRAMVDALVARLNRAADLYRDEPLVYAQMLSRLYDKTLEFSWDRAIRECRERMYALATGP